MVFNRFSVSKQENSYKTLSNPKNPGYGAKTGSIPVCENVRPHHVLYNKTVKNGLINLYNKNYVWEVLIKETPNGNHFFNRNIPVRNFKPP